MAYKKEIVQPYVEEQEFYESGAMKRHYKEVKPTPYNDRYEFIAGICFVIMAASMLSIAVSLSQTERPPVYNTPITNKN